MNRSGPSLRSVLLGVALAAASLSPLTSSPVGRRVAAQSARQTATDPGSSHRPRTADHARPAPVRVSNPAPPADVQVVVRTRPLVSPVTASMVSSMRAIIARAPALRADVFSKMGGSSVVNRGFLYCFEEEPTIDFGGRPLEDTLSMFRAGRVGRGSAFTRRSLAADVGWSLRQAFGGRPPYVLQEVQATSGRWALAFFGPNDVEGKNAHQFVTRLDRLVTTLADRGVVPILGATYPRRPNDPEMNEQVRRYNRLSSALASATGLVYVDFHQAMMPLPGRGLAGDGYHPNSYAVGPRSRACDFGAEGLRYGNNHRNLLTLTALDGIRRTLVANEAPTPDSPSATGAGTAADPARVIALPYARRIALESMPDTEASSADSCAGSGLVGKRLVSRVTVDHAMRIRASAVAMGPVETRIGVRRVGEGRCLGNGEDEQVLALEPGTYEILVLASASRRVPEDQLAMPARVLVVVDAEP